MMNFISIAIFRQFLFATIKRNIKFIKANKFLLYSYAKPIGINIEKTTKTGKKVKQNKNKNKNIKINILIS